MSENAEFEMPVPHPALKRLDFLVGSWDLKGSTVEGPMGPATEITGWETYEWMEGGFFLVHRWTSTFEVAGAQVVDSGYEFYDYDPATERYRTHFFNSLGPYDETGSKYHGGFDGDALVVTGPARIIRTPGADGSVTVDSEVPVGDDRWAPMMTYTLTRTSGES
ncbi:DUF1579 family protein [Planomonospora venezuelensis]|uniref:DUF1579 domain-containing protein n=1 Tax=Planomonospora venezuelensis TaxID=1999 RepID=A0A841DE36_PLAVE|nr:DUF1579 family protein [Planomonospora venezuelensis]MBB5966674.1 hypothetical protein [Planomonospora venezuelensis]GIN00355.1 hypothetical protein Pve01_20130 [Planomonospora venezuelensis]